MRRRWSPASTRPRGACYRRAAKANQPTELLPAGADFAGDSGATSRMSPLDFELDATDLSATAETGKRSRLLTEPISASTSTSASPEQPVDGASSGARSGIEPDCLPPDADPRAISSRSP